MQDKAQEKDRHDILELLDSPETDQGVILEAQHYGEEGCKALWDALKNPKSGLSEGQRARAVHLMGQLGCKDLIDNAAAILRDPDLAVRHSIVYVLPQLDRKHARSELLKTLDDSDVDAMTKLHALRVLSLDKDEALSKRLEAWAQGLDDFEFRAAVGEILSLEPITENPRGRE